MAFVETFKKLAPTTRDDKSKPQCEDYSIRNKKRISNLKSIGNLIEKHETNILFIRLKQKGEILSGNSYNSIYTKNYINQKH